MEKMDYWQKQNEPLFRDLEWNFPEQKSGTVAIIGGNGNSFSSAVKLAEYLGRTYPVKRAELYLPDSLRGKLPPVPGINFVPSTESGSIAKSDELNSAVSRADFSIFSGDLSKNSATTIAVTEAIRGVADGAMTAGAGAATGGNRTTGTVVGGPVLLARDAVDLITPSIAEFIDTRPLFLVASMVQLQKIFRSLLYPKMLLLSQPLMPTVETLHKFTLSYENCTIVTLHQEQIIVAAHGRIITTPLGKTKYTPLTLFTGALPADLAAYNLWNPGSPLEATCASLIR